MNVTETEVVEDLLTDWVGKAFADLYPDADLQGVDLDVIPTSEERFGDYQCNAAMGLARTLKMSPRTIAEGVAAAARPACVERAGVAGPGFINIFLATAWLERHLEALETDPRLGVPESGLGHTVVLDYSGPNIAKPMHVAHVRSTVIGNALDRIHRFLGFRVISDNHLGDWGTQFGLLIRGFREFADQDALRKEPIEELERVYVRSSERSRKDAAWLDEARAELVKLQQGDRDNLALWRRFVDLSVEEFQRVYRRLGITFDHMRGESYYHPMLAELVARLRAKGTVTESEGAQVMHLDDEGLPVCIVQKSDGGYNYTTTDLATIESRVREFNPDTIVYVTDERQQLHFKQVFSAARKMGVNTRLVHVWFGIMRLPEGTFSTREGNVIRLEKLLDAAEAHALAIVEKTSPEKSGDERREIARVVGIGAVKYTDLSQNPQSVVTFTWEKALALDGNSAPYLQYACARIASVGDKYRERFPGVEPRDSPIRLTEPVERRLALRLVRFPDTVRRAAGTYRPNVLADYLFDLAQVYSTFYQTTPFLKAEQGVRESRIRLCGLVARTLRMGLDLLGIETPDRI